MSVTMRHILVAVRTFIVFTVILGIAYPLLIWGIGQVAFNNKANGSLIESNSTVVASALIGQSFTEPIWFHSRPSAAGDGYDTLASGGTNLSANSPELTALISARRAAVAKEESVPVSDVPPDAVTASASGLDPNISSAYAYLQVKRVAVQNGLSQAKVRALVNEHLTGGTISPEMVNVVELNLALTTLAQK